MQRFLPLLFFTFQVLTGGTAFGQPVSPQAKSSSITPLSPEVKRQFDGNTYNGFNPSDNSLAVSGAGWIVSVSNSAISYFYEDGSIALNSQSLSSFYSNLNLPDTFFYSKVLYDPMADRFILITLYGKTPETSRVVISFSASPDPNDGWSIYNFDDIAGSTDTWVKDIEIGVSSEDLYITGNLYNSNQILAKSAILQFDKDLGYNGLNLNYYYWTNILNDSGQPTGSIMPISHGLNEGYYPGILLLASIPGGGNTMQLFKIDQDSGNGPLLYTYTIHTDPYLIGNNGAQPGTPKLLNVGDCRIRSAFFADGTIHYVHHEKLADGANGFRYGQLDTATNTVHSHRFGLPANTYAYPSIAPFFNGIGNLNTVLICFAQTSSSTFPGIRAITVANDFTASAPVSVKDGLSPISTQAGNVVLWGNYSGISRRHNAANATVWIAGSYGKLNQYANWVAEIAPQGSGPHPLCEQAVEVFCGDVIIGNTAGTPQNLPECSGTMSTAPGKWYRMIGLGGNVTLSTCSDSTSFNTKIGVFSGSCSGLTCVAGADDTGCPAHPTHTSLTFYENEGDEYFIYITGAGTATGNFKLSIQCKADASTCKGGQVLTSCSGTVTDGSGDNPYSNGLNCSWTISPTAATSVTLSFTAFDTENNFDVVKVYDGTSANDQLLGTFSGASVPGVLLASSGSMFITFETDGSSSGAGWSADYTCTALQKPVADFKADQLSGTAPLTVNFTNLSTNPPAAYLWDFGDNSSSSATSPMHTYILPGTYTVQLTAANLAGSDTKVRTGYITVMPNAQAPVAAFSTSGVCGQSELTVHFQDLSTNTPASWLWDFGNGQTSTEKNPVYTYTEPGIYSVKLTVGNVVGSDIEIKTSLITILPALNISVVPGNNACLGTAVTLEVSGAGSYTWQGTGLNATTGNKVIANPASPGEYVYTVIGTTNNCTSDPFNTTLHYVSPPVVQISASTQTACFGQSVQLTASGASSYTWSGAGLSGAAGPNVSATPLVPGTYVYSVTGTANGCTSLPSTVSISFSNIPVISVGLSSSTSCVGQPVLLTASGAGSYQWSGIGLDQTSGSQVHASPVSAGSFAYQVVGTVNGCQSAPQTVSVQFNSTPVISVDPVTSVICLGQTLILNATGAGSYLWEGPGVNGVVVSTVTVTPPLGNTQYTVRGIANGCQSAPKSAQVTVNPIPVVSLNASTNAACLGTPVILTALGASTYQWTGGGLDQTTGNQVNANPSLPGLFAYQVIGNSNGCQSAPQTISVQFHSIPVITVGPAATVLCAGQTVTLTASGAGSYTWDGPGASGVTVASVTVSPPPGNTLYTVRGITNGCQSAAQTAMVTVNPVPVVVVTGNNSPICLGDTVWLQATGAAMYQWSGPNLFVDSGTGVGAVPGQTGIINYQVTGTTGSCVGQAVNIPVTVLSNPLSVTVAVSGCPGPNLTFKATVVNGSAVNNITWYLNGTPVWAGPTYTLFNAVNGNQVYCTAAPQNAPLCTQPSIAFSSTTTVDCITVATNEAQTEQGFNLVPNPNTGLFELSIISAAAEDVDIQVIDAIGRLIARAPLKLFAGVHQYPMDLRDKPAGLYLLMMQRAGRKQVVRFVKE